MVIEAARPWVLVMLSVLLTACGNLGYLAQAARGQWQVQRGRQPIDALLKASDTDAALKARLALVAAARDFATRELGLPDNDSYKSYRALGRPYVVWNVVAAPEFSVQPLRWCFPITGCISYRGYFRAASARRYADALKAKGHDVIVGGVPAYSTLGKLSDPLLDTMLRAGDADLVGTLFHELAHQLIYVKGDSDFNEAFAMSVEQEGVARWFIAQGRHEELRQYQARRAAQRESARLFAAGRSALAAYYRQELPLEEMRAGKQQRMREVGAAVVAAETAQGVRSGYRNWIDAGLNNAHLASVATYFDCVPAFQRLLASESEDLPRFYQRVRELARGAPSARRALCAAR